MTSALANHQVLDHFQCPFEDPSSPSGCSFHTLYKSVRRECPFGHGAPKCSLREIPPYICFSYLTNCCTNEIIGDTGAQNRPSSDMLHRCSDGFHPSLEDLVDLEQLHMKMAEYILRDDMKLKRNCLATAANQSPGEGVAQTTPALARQSPPVSASTHEDQCAVCLESVLEMKRNFGILEHCNHIFCSDCIITWSEGSVPQTVRASNTRKCPLCRTESGKIAICQRLPASDAEKAKLFEQQYKCLELARGRTDLSTDDSSDDSDDDEVAHALNINGARDDARLVLISQLFEAISSLDFDVDNQRAAAAQQPAVDPERENELSREID